MCSVVCHCLAALGNQMHPWLWEDDEVEIWVENGRQYNLSIWWSWMASWLMIGWLQPEIHSINRATLKTIESLDQNLVNRLLLAPQIVIKWSVSTLRAQRSLLLLPIFYSHASFTTPLNYASYLSSSSDHHPFSTHTWKKWRNDKWWQKSLGMNTTSNKRIKS